MKAPRPSGSKAASSDSPSKPEIVLGSAIWTPSGEVSPAQSRIDAIAILLDDGGAKVTERDRKAFAFEVLEKRSVPELRSFSARRWMGEFGLSPCTARRMTAAFSLLSSSPWEDLPRRPSMRSAEEVFAFIAPCFGGIEEERFWVLMLDAKHALQRVVEATRGTLTSSLVHPREVFREAVREAAAAIVVVHNHPSGDPEPSREDVDVSRRLIDAGRLVGIPLIDHVVIGKASFVSLRERIDF